MLRVTLVLSAADRLALQHLIKHDPHWRVRERAQSVLLLAAGLTCQQVADQQALSMQTVSATRRRWLAQGLVGLPDRARSGAPAKLTAAQTQQLLTWARAEPLTLTALKARHVAAGGAPVHVNTLTGVLKRAGFVWKRTRHSLKKKRDDAKFAQAQQEISALRRQAQDGEVAVAYLDEAGFAQVHPNRSAWTPVGEQHAIPAVRGKRLNVIAAFLSTGQVISAALWCAINALIFVGFLGVLRQQVAKPLIIILDNASFHTARAIQPHLEVLRRQGVTLYFLPPYSPELNRVEKLWHLVKHTWMAAKHRDAATLEAEVTEILDQVGTRYHLAF